MRNYRVLDRLPGGVLDRVSSVAVVLHVYRHFLTVHGLAHDFQRGLVSRVPAVHRELDRVAGDGFATFEPFAVRFDLKEGVS